MPVITLNLPDSLVIPEGHEMVADFRRPNDGEQIFCWDQFKAAERIHVDAAVPQIVLGREWEPPPRLKGSGLWLSQEADGAWWIYVNNDSLWHGICINNNYSVWATLGLTTLPDLRHLPLKQRNIKL